METVKRDHFAEVTGKIIASLEAGIVPWRQPWGFVEPAQNHFSGHKYRGINSLLMLLADFKTPYFATMHQINEAGGKVKKGSKSVSVYFHDCLFKDKNGKKIKEDEYKARIQAGDKTLSKYPYIRLFPVFNMADVDGCPVKPSSPILNADNEPIPACLDFVTGVGQYARIINHPIKDAYFEKVQDLVMMPGLQRFESSELYYGILFHELTHWTGHPSRLNRATLKDALKFGDTNYSKEELTAELGANFLTNHFGIRTPAVEAISTSYISHWLGVLKKDKKFIWDVASDAQAAYAFLMALAE